MVEFIVIGAMKSGTTSFSELLSKVHLFQMYEQKEAQFFSMNYDDNHSVYDGLFENDNRIQCEASTCYSRYPMYKDVPKRIHNYNSEMKFIYLLRDPVSRAYSHYCHNIINDKINYTSFRHAIDTSDEVINSSKYMYQINQYLKYFKPEQILLLDFDELKKSPEAVLEKVFQFLGLDTNSLVLDKHNNKVHNKKGTAAAKRDITSVILRLRNLPFLSGIINFLIPKHKREHLRKDMVDYISNSFISKVLVSRKKDKVNELNEQDTQYVYEKIKDDICELEKFWGQNLSKWHR